MHANAQRTVSRLRYRANHKEQLCVRSLFICSVHLHALACVLLYVFDTRLNIGMAVGAGAVVNVKVCHASTNPGASLAEVRRQYRVVSIGAPSQRGRSLIADFYLCHAHLILCGHCSNRMSKDIVYVQAATEPSFSRFGRDRLQRIHAQLYFSLQLTALIVKQTLMKNTDKHYAVLIF